MVPIDFSLILSYNIYIRKQTKMEGGVKNGSKSNQI